MDVGGGVGGGVGGSVSIPGRRLQGASVGAPAYGSQLSECIGLIGSEPWNGVSCRNGSVVNLTLDGAGNFAGENQVGGTLPSQLGLLTTVQVMRIKSFGIGVNGYGASQPSASHLGRRPSPFAFLLLTQSLLLLGMRQSRASWASSLCLLSSTFLATA